MKSLYNTFPKCTGVFFILLILPLQGSCQNSDMQQSELVGGPCEGCEAVFEFGDRTLTPADTLPGFDQADEKLKITGTIYLSDGTTPAADVILYIHQTDEQGVYPTRGDESGWARRHGYLRGWIKTGTDGRYTFYTLIPGSYGRGPAHIHPIILEPDGKYYYIAEFLFEGDPNLRNGGSNRGGAGVLTLKQEGDMLFAERDIILGLNVPGYE